ncbi:uncharacterized protein B0J16DRAFT_401252 [Fusarium flagelliforme]|uniref:uncharacterized protein n=1 Tax=Fusarium flagelliforme TaxID=2675880 RepID=UPI001E8D67AF|nr:uncharacterized protein B0J16DRAFT_401252 [Fusarium flagelliforme]KAH7183022.1 hypothetical protein B0J16DRAFT_401252 [Fusarium flagelliforme]
MSKQPNKTEWTQDAKARIMSSEAKSGNNPEFAKFAQAEVDKNLATKQNDTKASQSGQQKK